MNQLSATNYYKFVQWDITSRGNLACIHCRSESFYGDRQLTPDLSLIEVNERLDDLYETGVRRVHFLGISGPRARFLTSLHRFDEAAFGLGLVGLIHEGFVALSLEIVDLGLNGER